MNASKFDRRTVERYISKGFDIDAFIKKYDFADESEFQYQLNRIYGGDTEKVERILKDLKKKTEKIQKKAAKAERKSSLAENVASIESVIKSANTVSIEPKVIFVKESAQPFAVTTANYNAIAKIAKNVTVTPEVAVETTAAVSKLDELKLTLSESEKYYSELSTGISEKTELMKEKVKDLKASIQAIKDLEKKVEEENAKFCSTIKELDSLEKDAKEKAELKRILEGEIEELKEKISKMEVKKVFFGTEKKGGYDIYGDEIEIPAIILMNKFNELVNTGQYEDMSLGTIRKLAKALCVIAEITANHDGKIEIYFQKGEYDKVVNNVKIITKKDNIKICS